MAFTQACLELDATTGNSAVYLVDPTDSDDRAPFTNPTANLTRTLFHSALDYPAIVYDQTLTVAFPALSSGSNYVQTTYDWPDHNAGEILSAFCQFGNAALRPNHIIQQSGTYRHRKATLALTTTGAQLSVTSRRDGSTLAAVTLSFRLFLIKAPAADTAIPFDIDTQTGVIQFGFGKFRNNGAKKLRLTNSGELFRVPEIGPTIDLAGRTMRAVYADGTISDLHGYSGSFAGSGHYKVKA